LRQVAWHQRRSGLPDVTRAQPQRSATASARSKMRTATRASSDRSTIGASVAALRVEGSRASRRRKRAYTRCASESTRSPAPAAPGALGGAGFGEIEMAAMDRDHLGKKAVLRQRDFGAAEGAARLFDAIERGEHRPAHSLEDPFHAQIAGVAGRRGGATELGL